MSEKATDREQQSRAIGAALRRCRNGDTRAFGRVVDTYERPLYALLVRMVGDPAVAAELCQETFLRAYRALDSYRDGAPFSPWIFRIARNLAIDFVRRAEFVWRAEMPGPVDGMVDPHAASPEAAVLAAETASAIERALAALSPSYREAVVLHLINGLSYAEMSEVTGVPIEAIKSRYLRGRVKLRRLLEDGGSSPC